MANKEKLQIVVAEMSPVISAGFSHCISRIHSLQTNVREIRSQKELISLLSETEIDLLLINPVFSGASGIQEIRNISINKEIKIIAIEIGKLHSFVSSLYDAVVSVTDDLETIESTIRNLCIKNIESREIKESLSLREKEIISLVVKGLTNQEIADKLFLSIHTVITHRRNIARKLEIHSATGLTIYAIVNKIVDLSEIKL